MSQTQSLRKKNSANNSAQPLQRSGTKNNSEALDKKTESAAQQDNAPLQKKAYRSALSSGQSAAQDEPRLQTKLSVSTPGDSHEQEADRVADEVVSRRATPAQQDNKLNPGSTKPENNASNPQSLQTKISRMAEPAPAATETPQTEAQTSLPAETATDNEQGVSAEVEQQIAGLRGQGAQLPEQVRTEMESQFNHDFSSVSIHNDSTADTLCKQLSARAFTVGSDIFFASGEYAPDSQEGKRLLAHELTHVVQQGSGVTRQVMREETTPEIPSGVQPVEPTPIGGPYEFFKDNKHYKYIATIGGGSEAPKELHLPEVRIPNFKERHSALYRPIPLIRNAGERRTNQRNNWRTHFTTELVQVFDRKLDSARRRNGVIGEPNSDSETFFFKGTRNQQLFLFGNRTQLLDRVIFPFWDRQQEVRTFQVDHRREDQMGGDDNLENYELLDASANGSSGTQIARNINNQIDVAISVLQSPYYRNLIGGGNRRISGDSSYIKDNYRLQFDTVRFNLGAVENSDRYWSVDHITQGEHLNQLRPLTEIEVREFGNPRRPMLYTSPNGGVAVRAPEVASQRVTIWPRVVSKGAFNVVNENQATLLVDAYRSGENTTSLSASYSDMLFHFIPAPGMGQETTYKSWVIDKAASLDEARDESQGVFTSLRLPGMSPIRIDDLDIDPGLGFVGRGKLLPSIPIFANADIDIVIQGSDIRLQKTFGISEIQVPAPFQISRASVTLFASSANGLGLHGGITVEIDRIGKCDVDAELSTANGLLISGRFNFDEGLFNGIDASVEASFHRRNIFDENDHGHWSVGGQIVIPRGKICGIETATVNLSYSDEEGFRAHGEATLSVPGVENGTIDITHNEEEGMLIGGTFNLRQGRGIRGGQISARVQEKPDGTGYAVTAHGEAQPDIPGINSNLIVDYNDGAFTAEVNADYSRGMLSGRVNAGVTNRTVNDDGTLSETAAEGNPLVVYGGGQLTLQIAPWLQGTAGVQFAPNGEVTVTGEIGLPGQLEIFARREINKSIFNIAVQAPIFPGIVAEVGGGLSATAGIGPGVIDQLRLGITYNPAHEEETRITGDAHLNIPANAGLRLSVRAGIGLGITGASATGGLDIGGTLGIEGAAEAGVHVEWTPATGLDIQAELALHAQPSFTFDIGGYVSVRALGFEVYDNRWEFASYTFGSDYRFGIRLPIHYHEGEPFEISTDDIEFEVPDIDTNQLLRGLIERIA